MFEFSYSLHRVCLRRPHRTRASCICNGKTRWLFDSSRILKMLEIFQRLWGTINNDIHYPRKDKYTSKKKINPTPNFCLKVWKSNKEYMRESLNDPSFIFIFLKMFVMKTKKNNMFFIYFSRPLIHGSKISISLSNISIIEKIQMFIWSTRLRPVTFSPSVVYSHQKIGQSKMAIFSLMLRIHMLIGQDITLPDRPRKEWSVKLRVSYKQSNKLPSKNSWIHFVTNFARKN